VMIASRRTQERASRVTLPAALDHYSNDVKNAGERPGDGYYERGSDETFHS
jgi:hypothetical protein